MGDDELGHFPRRDLADVNFAIRFQRAARFEHRHPLNGVDVPADFLSRGQQNMIFHVENARRAIGALQQFADPDKIPAFAVVMVASVTP